MAFLIEREFHKYYYIKYCSSAFCFVFIMYVFILFAPFFAVKASEKFWSLSDIYYEQPSVNYLGNYVLYCQFTNLDYESKFYSNISPLDINNDEDIKPSLAISRNDFNMDDYIDNLEITFTISADSSNIKSCELFMIMEYGLRKEVKLQMQSPLKVLFNSDIGIKKAIAQGNINFFQKYPLVSTSVTRNVYNYTVPQSNLASFDFETFIKEYIQRNESVSASYNTYVIPGESNLFSVELKIQLQVPLFQEILYVPKVLDNMKFFWIQYVSIFIPIFCLITCIVNFSLRNNIFENYVKTDLPKDLLVKT